MSEKVYTRYVQDGPSTMSTEDVITALTWRDSNRAEALSITRRSDERAREQTERETLKAAWEIQGNDPSTFEAHFKRLRQEHQAAKLAELEHGARGAAWRSMWRTF